MGFTEALKNHIKAPPQDDIVGAPIEHTASVSDYDAEKAPAEPEANGVSNVEVIQAIWGKKGRYLIIAGLAMMMIMYEVDNTVTWQLQTYETSDFEQLSMLATLGTAGTIIWAVIKPVIAKISDVIGRGETYCFTISCYVLSYILCANAKSFNTYAGGYIFYCIGQTGTNIMNDILISDITSPRWRAFGLALSFFPFLIVPWCSAYIVSSVIGGIGWRWGIGMMAILMPVASSFIIGTLLFFQRKAKKEGLVVRQRMSIYEFCSLIDFGGSFLLMAGFALLLIPITLASTTTSRWSTPWIDALIAVGVIILILMIPYEIYVAKHPIMPPRYFKNLTIVCCFLIGAFDNLGFSATHTYFYTWSIVTHFYDIKEATYVNYVNGITQCLVGIIVGLVVMKTRRYKWIVVVGATVRLIGYGVMIRIRGTENSTAELVIVQLIQGIGSGFLTIIEVTAAQLQVPHSEMAQVTALVLLFSFLGSSVGACIAGGIYTNTFKPALHRFLGADATTELVNTVYGSITGDIPGKGTTQRAAINNAYSEVMRNITYAALGVSVLILIFCLLLPDLRLREDQSFVGSSHDPTAHIARDEGIELAEEQPTKTTETIEKKA